MKYRYIFVDLDNTLLDFEAAEEYSFYYTAQSRGLSFGEAELERYQAINAPLWKMMERREITKDALVVRRFRELFEELGITGIDPLRYNLLFERFLNPERVSMPDFDIDFCYVRRQEVIDYVVEKYGKDCVVQIVTFGTMAARAVIKDVGRVLDLPYAMVDNLSLIHI